VHTFRTVRLDDPPVEPELAPPTIASSSPLPPPEDSVPIAGIVMSVGLRGTAGKAALWFGHAITSFGVSMAQMALGGLVVGGGPSANE
jgi:hypothetical protein